MDSCFKIYFITRGYWKRQGWWLILIKNKKVIDGFITNKVSIESNLQNTILKGVGVENIVFNDDSSFTIILTDGTEYTTEPLKGDIGITPNLRIGTI